MAALFLIVVNCMVIHKALDFCLKTEGSQTLRMPGMPDKTHEDHTSSCWSLLNEPVTDISKEWISGSNVCQVVSLVSYKWGHCFMFVAYQCHNINKPGLTMFCLNVDWATLILHMKIGLSVTRSWLLLILCKLLYFFFTCGNTSITESLHYKLKVK